MPDCSCCKKDREGANEKPRVLERLPIEITQHRHFKRKGLPILLCPVCDEHVYAAALAEHEKRIGN